ncbi:hypothetical protein L202_02795 [Cryptococcus amylolentus CBS 6039]|uniref:Transcription initiation factor TFIID subunit 13 n=2 Tax=Cryptococcus amylolentus TaxID=104669 RepID=A0A1E3HWR2_9TREE|nr:hypothetical protein L202_02795 [Cryptococcus amylolentus CBS 6039]ODN80605.1 hypothetical protein L202_02795 [Cryptococcus amylolentus CBS 6039]ODO09171.1 hypothetical protein I350_02771 [Cryptococcus amylolentus CBS 6273]
MAHNQSSAQYLASARPNTAAPLPGSLSLPRPNSTPSTPQYPRTNQVRPLNNGQPFRPNPNVHRTPGQDVFGRSRVPAPVHVPSPSYTTNTQQASASGGERRRGVEGLGLRGTMRNEISRLMYGAGDVADPLMDTVDYMEDLVVEFLADLCRPVPPIRSNPTVQHQAVPLTAEILRHRLDSTTALHKYRERFDHMLHMSEVLKQHKRVADPNFHDIVNQVGGEYLGLHDNAPGGGATGGDDAGAGSGGQGQKRTHDGEGGEPPKKKGRPPKPPGERKKPGPQKGWKLNRDPNAPTKKAPRDPNMPKRKYVRKAPLKSQMGTPAPESQ